MAYAGDAAYVLYLILGPLTWAALLLGMVAGRARMNRLKSGPATFHAARETASPQALPQVTVLVPARNEVAGIQVCLASVLQQDWPHIEVLAVNDRSTDGTGPLLDKLAEAHPALRVVHIDALPAGWLGKAHALATAAAEARGQWLLFVDSDVTLQPDALCRCLRLATEREIVALSLLTRVEAQSMLEAVVLPLAAGAWAVMHTISLTNSDRRTHIAVANGPFLLVRRDVYETAGGHTAVRQAITEDVELMRRIKAAGGQVRLLAGEHLAATRMHKTWRQLTHGWGRIFSGTSRRKPGRILAALPVVAGGLAVYPALAAGVWELHTTGWPGWLVTASVHLAVLTAALALVYRWARLPMPLALAWPLGGLVLAYLLSFALRVCKTGISEWRGTAVQQQAAGATEAA